MDKIEIFARAKINTALDVTGKREDGYHDLRMIMQTVNLCDSITIEKTKLPGIELTANLSWLPCDSRNLIYRAAEEIINRCEIKKGVKIQLFKRIPAAAGLAGGSSDCAATLIAMRRLFGLNITNTELMKIGEELGADVPYCIMRGTALAEGKGEILTRLPAFPDAYVLLAKPPINVSTPAVFKEFSMDRVEKRPDIEKMISCIEKGDLKGICDNMCNVLETVTIKNYPVIADIKRAMLKYNAIGSMMSGSGPTVFGFFNTYEEGIEALKYVRNTYHVKEIYLTTVFNIKQRD
ncbi:MAG: 4-(cytidine 5'-diphospho)-2-C-methyl-D-erythritol kinase [Firmicutes bacterium]|nr:4-(cytidine 5'-diphospho)-2-C-methyl-D-erythritol kinase [Bacillota bacterium]